MHSEYDDDDNIFELEINNICREMWPNSLSGGAIIVEGKERDGVYITDDAVYLIEATRSRKKEKATKDCGKIASLFDKYSRENPFKAIKGFFITADEPTADQRAVANAYSGKVVAVSFNSFRSNIVDGNQYIQCRKEYRFGSISDPETLSERYEFKYIPLDIENIATRDQISISDIACKISRGEKKY